MGHEHLLEMLKNKQKLGYPYILYTYSNGTTPVMITGFQKDLEIFSTKEITIDPAYFDTYASNPYILNNVSIDSHERLQIIRKATQEDVPWLLLHLCVVKTRI